MSRLAKNYQKVMKKELSYNAAWPPIINTFEIGEYGYFEGGVFRSLGNIKKEYPGLELRTQDGPPASINFSSEGVNTSKIDGNGNLVDTFSGLGDAKVNLKFDFTKENTIVVKSSSIVSKTLENISEVADYLSTKKSWRRKYKIVSEVYTAKNAFVLCSKEKDSSFTISGSANLLKKADVGDFTAGLEFSSSKKAAVEHVGESGVIAIGLFKLNWLTGQPKFLTAGTEYELQTEFDSELEDDF